MPQSKRPRKKLSRQVREEYIAAARKRAMVRRQRVLTLVSLLLVAMLGVFGVLTVSGPTGDDATEVSTPATTSPEQTDPDCPPREGSTERRTIFQSAPRTCIDRSTSYRARFVTSAGIFVAELDAESAPKAVNNFVFLARWRFYEGLPFHKVVPNNYIQTGDPKGAGITGPGYFFEDDPLPEGETYEVGDLLVAHEAPNQNGSQFLVLVGDGPQGTLLPPAFPEFGRVIRGMDVVRKIVEDGDPARGDAKVEHLIESVEIIESAAGK